MAALSSSPSSLLSNLPPAAEQAVAAGELAEAMACSPAAYLRTRIVSDGVRTYKQCVAPGRPGARRKALPVPGRERGRLLALRAACQRGGQWRALPPPRGARGARRGGEEEAAEGTGGGRA